ncbi:MAG: SulP family inorganic anion transporter [Anaerolineae bacterium]|nr:SulP family inorganic anion transporter [Anaerolineae bacterium]
MTSSSSLAQKMRVHLGVPSLATLSIGLTLGIFKVIFSTSSGVLLFNGVLSPYNFVGVSLALMTSFMLGILLALTSSLPSTLSGSQDVPMAMLAVLIGSVMAQMPDNTPIEQRFLTALGTIAVVTVITGLFFLLLGYFKLSNLVRFLPFPVIGGFFGGTGLLMIKSAFSVMAGISLEVANLPRLIEAGNVAKWLPGVIFGVIVTLWMRRRNHISVLPTAFFASIVLFYVGLGLSGMSFSQAVALGWLNDASATSTTQATLPVTTLLTQFSLIRWDIIFQHFDVMLSLTLIATITFLLYCSGIQLAAPQEVDINHELAMTGLANLVVGAVAAPVGYHTLSSTVLMCKEKSASRWGGIAYAAVCFVAFLLGNQVLGLVPKPVLGGVLFFIAFTFLIEWVYDARQKVSPVEYVIMLGIMLVTTRYGFLEAVGVGLLVTIITFLVNYSRVQVIKHEMTALQYRSRLQRPPNQTHYLQQHGEKVRILQLHNYIFFGTAYQLYEHIRKTLPSAAQAGADYRFLVLDFKQVSGLDSTALLAFRQLLQLLKKHDITLLLADLNPHFQQLFEKSGLLALKHVQPSANLDRALEWCEAQLLADFDQTLTVQDEKAQQLFTQLLPYLEPMQVEANDVIMKQGTVADEMFFVRSGCVTVQLESANQAPIRLETMCGERMVGEMGFFLWQNRTATVLADGPTVLYRLSRERMAELEQRQPNVALALQRMILEVLSERVTQLNSTVATLQK